MINDGDDNPDSPKSIENQSNRSQPDLGDNKSLARSSKSQPQNNKKAFQVPSEIMKQLEKNQFKEAMTSSFSKISSRNLDKNNSQFRTDSDRNNLKGDSIGKLSRQDAGKIGLSKEDLSFLKTKKLDQSVIVNNSTPGMECIPENPEKGVINDPMSKDKRLKKLENKHFRDSKEPKNKKEKGEAKNESSKGMLNMFLKKSENIWRKSLTEIFCFYSKLQKQTKGEYSFENFKEKMNHMSLGEWIKFCLDYGLVVPKPRTETFSAKEYNRKFLTNLFKTEAKGNLGINYASFQVLSR